MAVASFALSSDGNRDNWLMAEMGVLSEKLFCEIFKLSLIVFGMVGLRTG